MPFFDITHKEKNTRARTGIIHTDHGDIETPIFMPVGTQATVKSLDPKDLEAMNAQIILGNTYHLHLRPGENLIANFGGLHKFMQWHKPILTDSGGFQVFSLGSQQKNKKTKKQENNIRKSGLSGNPDHNESDEQSKLVDIDEDGVTFRSYIDGSEHRFTPESAIDIQHKLGADIIMAFDECTPDSASYDYTKQAMERTHRWAERSLTEHKKLENGNLKLGNTSTRFPISNFQFPAHRQFLFGIIQGANHKELREESARVISSMDFDGIAIGGESIGYNMEATKEILDWVYPLIPENKPHYAMGLGFSPSDLFEVVERGIDMFDCVAPTRMARNGTLYVSPSSLPPSRGELEGSRYRINITNAKFREDKNPIDPTCTCSTCARFSRAYLHHLFAANELLAYRLASIHNLHFFLSLMAKIRHAIQEDTFLELKKEWI